MTASPAAAAQRYYDDLAAGGDFASVPMADDLRFAGPLHSYADGARYRRDMVALAAAATGLVVRHRFVEGVQVHTVYDLDLGLPTGPVATAESLTFDRGVMVAADLIIDPTPLRAPA